MSEVRLIDANALRKSFKKSPFFHGSFYLCYARQLIDNAPTIEERPKGKWELFEKRPCQNLYMCSNCGHIIESMPDRLAENFKGCYCGADMRGDV